MSINSGMNPSRRLKLNLGSIILTAMLLSILIIQEEVLVLLPNIQLTTLLIMVYASILPISLLTTLIVSYVFIDSLLMGGMNLMYIVPMVVIWIALGLVSRALKDKPFWILVLIATLYGFVYGWSFIPATMIAQSMFRLWPYLLSDLPFELIMAGTNLVTVLLLYKPLRKVLTQLVSEMN